MSDLEPDRDEPDPKSYAAWREGGFRGPPPWRRGFRPGYFAVSVLLTVVLAVVFWFAFSGR